MFLISVLGTLSICNYDFNPTFTAVGGSNTVGANAVSHVNKRTKWGKPHETFAKKFYNILPLKTIIKYGADGGRGPIFLSACSAEFISNSTRYATVEYLPNIGYLKDDNAELGSVKNLLNIYKSLGALVFLINIVPGSFRYKESMDICGKYNNSVFDTVIGCLTRKSIEIFRNKLVNYAKSTRSHVIEVDADKNPELFGADMFHLNQDGHDFVFKKMSEVYNASSCLKHTYYTNYTNIGVSCKHGNQIKEFLHTGNIVNLSPPVRNEKIAVEPVTDNITMIVSMPNETSSFENPIIWNSKDRKIKESFDKNRFKIGLGFHTSKNESYGVANITCMNCSCTCGNGDCRMNTSVKSTSSVTMFKTLLTNNTWCIIMITVSERKKIYLRDLVVGLNDFRTKWLS